MRPHQLGPVLATVAMISVGGQVHAGIEARWAQGGTDVSVSSAKTCSLIVSMTPDAVRRLRGLRLSWVADRAVDIRLSRQSNGDGALALPRDTSMAALDDYLSRREQLDLGSRGTSQSALFIVAADSGASITIGVTGEPSAQADPIDPRVVVTMNHGWFGSMPLPSEVFDVRSTTESDDSTTCVIRGVGIAQITRALVVSGDGLRSSAGTLHAVTSSELVCRFGSRAFRAARAIVLVDRFDRPNYLSLPVLAAENVRPAMVRVAFSDPLEAGSSSIGAQSAPIAPADRTAGLLALGASQVQRLGDPSLRGRTTLNGLGEVVDLTPTDSIYYASLGSTAQAIEFEQSVDRTYPEATTTPLPSVAHLMTEPNDTFWSQQWNLHDVTSQLCGMAVSSIGNSIGAPDGWSSYAQLPTVLVGIIDTGISNVNHDTQQAYASGVPFRNIVNPSEETWDLSDDSHGTAVASIAAAQTNWQGGAYGIAGAGWSATPCAIKVWDGQGDAFAQISAGIDWATLQGGIPILNVSMGASQVTTPELDELARICRNAFRSGLLIVASIGNDNRDFVEYPAGLKPWVCAVGATLWNGLYWSDCNIGYGPGPCDTTKGSNYGPHLDLMAPSGRLVAAANKFDFVNESQNFYLPNSPSCIPSVPSTMAFGGTSSSAPLVAGAAAWLKSVRPELTGEDLQEVLFRTATDRGSPGYDVRYGHGVINLQAATEYVLPPYLVRQGLIGEGGEGALSVVDSSSTSVRFTHTTDGGILPGQSYAAERYRLRGTINFESGFSVIPDVWVRTSTTRGARADTVFNDLYEPSWGGICPGSLNQGSADFETFVYRVIGAGNKWFPASIDHARVAFSAVGISLLAGVQATHPSDLVAIHGTPNPSRGRVRLEVSVPVAGPGGVEIFDVLGRHIARLLRGPLKPGQLQLTWDGRTDAGEWCNPGIYLCRAEVSGRASLERLVLLR